MIQNLTGREQGNLDEALDLAQRAIAVTNPLEDFYAEVELVEA